MMIKSQLSMLARIMPCESDLNYRGVLEGYVKSGGHAAGRRWDLRLHIMFRPGKGRQHLRPPAGGALNTARHLLTSKFPGIENSDNFMSWEFHHTTLFVPVSSWKPYMDAADHYFPPKWSHHLPWCSIPTSLSGHAVQEHSIFDRTLEYDNIARPRHDNFDS